MLEEDFAFMMSFTVASTSTSTPRSAREAVALVLPVVSLTVMAESLTACSTVVLTSSRVMPTTLVEPKRTPGATLSA